MDYVLNSTLQCLKRIKSYQLFEPIRSVVNFCQIFCASVMANYIRAPIYIALKIIENMSYFVWKPQVFN